MYDILILVSILYLIYVVTYYVSVYIIDNVLGLCTNYNFNYNKVLKYMLFHHIRSYICYIILFIVTKRIIIIDIIVESNINWVSFMMRSLLLMILYDFGYYILHYLLHSNAYLYRTIHKVHHYYQCDHPLIAHYTSIIELVILNLLKNVLQYLRTFYLISLQKSRHFSQSDVFYTLTHIKNV